MRLIDADALIEEIKNDMQENELDASEIDAIKAIKEAPTIEERPKGEWELFEKRPYLNLYMCSNCGHIIESMPDKLAENFKGCYCGADMRGEENG